MLTKDKKGLKKRDRLYEFGVYFFHGCHRVFHSILFTLIGMIIFSMGIYLGVLVYFRFSEASGIDKIYYLLLQIEVAIIFALISMVYLYLVGRPFQAPKVNNKLMECGFVNSIGIAPLLIKSFTDKDNKKVKVMIFENNSTPLSSWNDNKDKIEAALNITITNIKYLEGKELIELKSVKASEDYPEVIKWNSSYLSSKDFELVIGIGPDGLPIKINLNVIPMCLIGGSTGSGKSVLLKSLLMQCINKGAEIYISDFKGGVDFSFIWHKKCHMLFEVSQLEQTLKDLVSLLESRKRILKESGYPNISSYNAHNTDQLNRIIFACDEIAEVLDTRGMAKDRKEIISHIESYLSTIARQGRAFGIHLMLATQRPDANIIPGQIKNNCQCKICGSCDQVLSQIVLDCTDASDLIPKDTPGRFMINDSKMSIFQGFMIEEEHDIL